MKLTKNAQKSFHTFIFPSDEGIDWKASAKSVMDNLGQVFEDFKDNIKEIEKYKDYTDDQIKELYAFRADPNTIYQVYVSSKYQDGIIKGDSCVTFVFEDITHLDMKTIFKAFPKAEAVMTGSKALKDNEDSVEEVAKFLKTVMIEKVHDVQYPESVKQEDRFSKQDLINHIFQAGLGMSDINALQTFIVQKLNDFGSKKKILSPTAG